MTDTPGWASPSSSEQPRDEARPPADAPAAVPGQSVPPHAAHPAPGAGHVGAQYGAPGPHGQPGQYGPYGWGAPPSPKPGVIPLRPLGVGEILDGAVSTIRTHWRTTLGLSLGLAVIEQGGTLAAQLAINGSTGNLTQALAGVVVLPLNLLIAVIASALLTMVVSRAVLGKSATAGEAWREARPQLLRMFGLSLLSGLIWGGIVLLGFTPLIGYVVAGADEPAIVGLLVVVGLLSVPAAVWVGVQLSLAAPALMLEKQGITAALSRSRRLVRGAWWRQAGINLLAWVLSFIVSMIIATPFAVIGMALGFDHLVNEAGSTDASVPASMLVASAIGGIIASTLTIPFSAAITVLLYVDQRIRREALDIELARAAGLPEYGGTGWSDPVGPNPARR
ncbi:hypothetical protein J5Y04_32840 [Kitasatospora sp. RG8]|uniref:DUF7544 domain-containing protein n=1 Tax=Kitasatospora sp. RG8 TaxID=2820815 RepID=UPI001ADFF8F1|nr:hypothetical protein [Kitasatospora sp. RG8]MBP0454286.1 hypothetical protein [Kitasatospora sp. RG8]